MTHLIHLRISERKSLALIYSLHNCILFDDQVSSRAHVLYGPCMFLCTLSVIEGDGTCYEENLRNRPFLIRYSKLQQQQLWGFLKSHYLLTQSGFSFGLSGAGFFLKNDAESQVQSESKYDL